MIAGPATTLTAARDEIYGLAKQPQDYIMRKKISKKIPSTDFNRQLCGRVE